LQEPTVDVGAGLVQAPLVLALIPFPPKHVTSDVAQSDHKVKESV